MNQTPEQLTVKEALEQGYTKFIVGEGFQCCRNIAYIDADDFEQGPVLDEKESYQPPAINSTDIAEMLADYMEENWGSETQDDTNEVYETVKALDFTATAELVNKSLEAQCYYRGTQIKLIP